nr:hypothetical protein [uncultured Mediterranean phage uvMED]
MPYLGRSSNFGVRSVFHYLPSAGDTSVSGADADGKTLAFADGNYIDVYLNGVKLKHDTDYNTDTANTVAGLTAVAANDEVSVVVYDAFSLATGFETLGGTFGDDITFKHDGVVLNFGVDSDITLTHVADTGLILKNTDTSGNSGVGAVLTLQTGDTDMAAGNTHGQIRFQAPDEGTGTDAILEGARIQAAAEGDFSSSSNATKLQFFASASGVPGSDPGTRMELGSDGNLTIKDLDSTDGSSATLTLQSGDTDIAASDVLGTIDFQAPDEATGTDAILVAAGIAAVSEGDFSSSSNATKLSFKTAASAAAAETMALSSAGVLSVTGKITAISDTNTDITLAGSDVITVTTGGTERIRIDADGSFLKGTATARTNSGVVPRFQIEGSTTNETTLSIVRNSNDDNASSIRIGKTRGTSAGSNTSIADDDFIGLIRFFTADGTDRDNDVASIFCQIDGTPGGNDTPGKLTFNVAADGTNSSSQAMMIEEDGRITINQTDNQGTNRLLVQEENDNDCLMVRATNASFSKKGFLVVSNRTGASAFNLIDCESNNTGDTEFRVRGDGVVTADGTITGGGADYAEFFEWKDGNSSSEDRIGISVKLDENKIIASSDSDNSSDIIGVVSGNPAVTGDSAWNKWNQKHLRDDYGRYIWEEYTATEWTEIKTNSQGVKEKNYFAYETDKIPSDVTVPSDAKVVSTESDGSTKLTRRKLNPDYDESKTYVSREDRKEWDTVGMMGKLRMKKGQKTGTNWIKMRDISDTVEEWLVR